MNIFSNYNEITLHTIRYNCELPIRNIFKYFTIHTFLYHRKLY